MPLTVQCARLRFSSAGCALGLPGAPDSVPPYPYKDARHTFRVACRPGGQGMSAPGDSRLTQTPTSVLPWHSGRPRGPGAGQRSIFRRRFLAWGCSSFGGVALPRPEGQAHLGGGGGIAISSRDREGQASRQPASDAGGPNRARPGCSATSGSAQTPRRRRPERPSPGWLFPGVLWGGRAELTITNPAAAATRCHRARAALGPSASAG